MTEYIGLVLVFAVTSLAYVGGYLMGKIAGRIEANKRTLAILDEMEARRGKTGA